VTIQKYGKTPTIVDSSYKYLRYLVKILLVEDKLITLNIFFINIYNAKTCRIQVNFSTPYVDVRDNHLMLDETLFRL